MTTDGGAVELALDHERHQAVIRIRREEHGNRLTRAMARQFVAHLDAIDADDDIKVAVIEGTGAHLSSGWDPREAWEQYVEAPGGAVKKHPSQRARLVALSDEWWGPNGLYRRLLHCRKVTIAKAVGDCYETGLYLTLCSDLAVAHENARFAVPRWRNVGVDGDLSLLIATVGLKRTKELMYAGTAWDAGTASRYGLVDGVSAAPDEEVGRLAEMCASIMRDGIVTEKYAVFASLAKMGVDHAFAAATVVGASLSNIHFQPGEYNFLADRRRHGTAAALERSRRDLG
ncbi:enoyl-CoA hydratase/isomerase family protein [Phytohabitans sp. ZYX-F-186]|uniref:Enoyl-CoA hydratase/isomerase family protein n=1 Tax=Phytohabitans maris TaxID=3071409 RepID=A0ABU0ZM44_9ACTN|nr:enoyl-CoA hydratase/isomerase family protein [Phytohabitans sp. ZYX-F-186]MDQ7907464.1 enoyl-CoA hydratase/isomerase family protein [Phytohabitans sp. ZYX-F-186]